MKQDEETCYSLEPVDEQYKVRDENPMSWIVLIATIYSFGFYVGTEYNYGMVYVQLVKEYNSTLNNFYAGKLKDSKLEGNLNEFVRNSGLIINLRLDWVYCVQFGGLYLFA